MHIRPGFIFSSTKNKFLFRNEVRLSARMKEGAGSQAQDTAAGAKRDIFLRLSKH
jgi:hypothetical protein